MGKPNPTKRLPTTRLDQLVMVRDEGDEPELLAFENEAAAWMFESCLGDSGYGIAYGPYKLEWPSMDQVRKTQGYQDWLKNGQRVIGLAYVEYVSDRMYHDSDGEVDVSGDLLNCGTVTDAYVDMSADGDWMMLFPDECEDDEDDEDADEMNEQD
jgi:hypothetical protein